MGEQVRAFHTEGAAKIRRPETTCRMLAEETEGGGVGVGVGPVQTRGAWTLSHRPQGVLHPGESHQCTFRLHGGRAGQG